MHAVSLTPRSDSIETLEKLYTKFDLGPTGYPTPQWEGRNLKELTLKRRLKYFYAPELFISRLLVNRRMVNAIALVFDEINERWDPQRAEAENLDQYVRTYCFGCDGPPNPFWWGAGYRLSPLVTGVALEEVLKIFTRHGFTWAGATDKKLVRDLYYL